MITWSICLNGKPYSVFASTLRSLKHAKLIIEQWKAEFTSSGYPIPEGEITSIPRK